VPRNVVVDMNLINYTVLYDGGVSDQLGLTERYRARTRLGTNALTIHGF